MGAVPTLAQDQNLPPEPSSTGWRKFSEPRPNQPMSMQQDRVMVPSQFVLPEGSWITVRIDDPLSSNHNQPGDPFTSTLVQPVVADGFVVSRLGQVISGRVVESVKGGKMKGVSHLSVELIELSLADGRRMPVKTGAILVSAGPSKGRDASAIAASTATGAMIGAAVGCGVGAGIGAAIGAAASSIGVMATRGYPTEVYPETVMRFRTLAPLTITVNQTARAFLPARNSDYEQQLALQPRVVTNVVPYAAPYPAPYATPYYAGYGYGGYYGVSPYYYSPWYFGGFYGAGYYGGGYYRGGYNGHGGYYGGGHYGGGYHGGGGGYHGGGGSHGGGHR
jgi:hypothetical protein